MAESDFDSLAPANAYAQRLLQDDRTLALAVHEGDQAAAVALIDRYFDPIFNLVHSATGMAATAEETAQAVIIGRLRHLLQKPPARDEPRWIAALAASAWRLLLELGLPPERRARQIGRAHV